MHPPGDGAEQRFALVTAYFWPERLGCGPYMGDLARHFAATGACSDVFTAVPHYPCKTARMETPDAGKGLGRMVIRRAFVFDRSSGGLVLRLANDLLFVFQTLAALVAARRRWDSVLVLVPTVLMIPALRLVCPRTRIVAAVYDIESRLAGATGIASSRVAAWLGGVEAWCLNRADAVLVLTQQMKEILISSGIERPIAVVPLWPGVPPDDTEAEPRARTLIYSGGLSRRHGAHILVDLWRQLAGLDFRLIVQSDALPGSAILRALAELRGDLVLCPTVGAAALAERLREASLQLVLVGGAAAAFSMPSKALTGLAAGVPYVTNAPLGSAAADLASASGGGHVVAATTEGALAQAIITLCGAPEKLRAMGRDGRAYVAAHHDRKTLLDRYKSLLSGPVA